MSTLCDCLVINERESVLNCRKKYTRIKVNPSNPRGIVVVCKYDRVTELLIKHDIKRLFYHQRKLTLNICLTSEYNKIIQLTKNVFAILMFGVQRHKNVRELRDYIQIYSSFK